LYLGLLCAMLLVNVATWRHRVPLFLSSAKAANHLLTLLPTHAGFRFIDLGCGTGSLLARLACARPDGRFTGIELAPLPYLMSRGRARRHDALDVRWGSFWRADLSRYNVVYAYLSPAPMARLWRKARREMRPGSLFVSNGFCVPGVAPAHSISVGDRVRSTLYVWQM
jgi:SAM-dependent methyltransferase